MRRLLLALAAAGLIYLALSIRRVPEGTVGVRDSAFLTVEPAGLQPGLRLVLRGLFRLTLYGTGTSRIVLGEPAPLEIVTAEGAKTEAAIELDVRIAPERVERAHRRSGGAVEAWLAAEVRHALSTLIGSPAFATLHRGNLPSLETAAQRLLSDATRADGVELSAFRFRRLGYQGAPLIAAGPRASVRRKVLWLAIDGFDWEIIRPLVQAGRMPRLQRLMEEGASGNLRAVDPLISPVIWTSVATGKGPEKHGIVDFLASDPATGAVLPVTSTLRRTRAFWNILGDADVSVGVIAWWASFPAERVNGFMATDRISYQLFKGRIRDIPEDNPLKAYPADLYPKIAPLIAPPTDITDEEVSRFMDLKRFKHRLGTDDLERLEEFRTMLASAKTYATIGMKLFRERPTDLRVIYFEGPDTAAHLFMPFVPPRAGEVPEEKVEWFARVVPEFYAYQDEWIGRFIDTFADGGTTVLISSDHGFKSGADRPATESRISRGRAADWHEREGVVLFAGQDIRRGGRILGASVLDLVPTLLALYGLPVGEDMDGKVLTAALTEEFLAAHPVDTIATYETPGVPRGTAGATAARAAGDDEELLAKLQSLGYLQQSMPAAEINQGAVSLLAGDYPTAIRVLETALKKTESDSARFMLARAYRLAGQEEASRRELERLLHGTWKRAVVLTELAAIQSGRKEWAEAERILQEALEADPNSPDVPMEMGRLCEQQRRWREAETWYEKVILLDPSHGEAFNQLGIVLHAQGKIPEAIRQLEKGIAVSPDLPGLYNNLGMLYRREARLEQARQVLESGVTMAPENAILHNSLGSLYHDMGQSEQARRHFENALELEPAYVQAVANLVALYQGQQNGAMAQKYLKRLLELEPDNSEARLILSLDLIEQNKVNEAEKLLLSVLKKEPENFQGLVTLGTLRLRQGQAREAAALLERAGRVDGTLPPLWNDLAQAYLALGRMGDARGVLRRSLSLDPNQPEIARLLAKIGG